MSCTFPMCNNVGELQIWSGHTLYIYCEPVFTIPALLSTCCKGTLDGNMTSIYTANDSREVPIFNELYLVGSSIRDLDVILFQFTYSIAYFVDYFACSRITYTTEVSCSRLKVPDAKNLKEISTCREGEVGLPLRESGESLCLSKQMMSAAFSLYIWKRSCTFYLIKIIHWVAPVYNCLSVWPWWYSLIIIEIVQHPRCSSLFFPCPATKFLPAGSY